MKTLITVLAFTLLATSVSAYSTTRCTTIGGVVRCTTTGDGTMTTTRCTNYGGILRCTTY